jgi:hypothetical protein
MIYNVSNFWAKGTRIKLFPNQNIFILLKSPQIIDLESELNFSFEIINYGQNKNKNLIKLII